MAQNLSSKTVDVLTFFENGKMDPIKFKMNGKVYPVKRIYKKWQVKHGASQLQHFLIESSNNNNFELRFDSSRNTWQLVVHN